MIAELPVAVRAALVASAQKIAQDAKDRLESQETETTDYGPDLGAAIHWELTDEGVEVIAGDHDAFWGHIIEHGGVNHPPHPFLVPALEQNRDETIAALKAAVRKAAG